MHAELKFPGNVHLPKRMVPERSMSARRSMKLSGMIRIGLVEVLTLSTLCPYCLLKHLFCHFSPNP
jgi:hypothetical protein